MRLSQGLLLDMELLKKNIPAILDMKNANKVEGNFFQNSTSNRMTNFNIS